MVDRSIGYNGQPLRRPIRQVEPPVAVLVDLTSLFARQPHPTSSGYHPSGLQLNRVVTGRLSHWGLCEQGQWWGLVTYAVAHGTRQWTVTHWIPGWMLRRA